MPTGRWGLGIFSWIFVDRESQETFRIRTQDPSWQTGSGGALERAHCVFDIVAEDGTDYRFDLKISGSVLDAEGVQSGDELTRFVNAKAVDIVETVLSEGFRGDQEILWEPDGVSVVR